jgi:hypothetical protein
VIPSDFEVQVTNNEAKKILDTSRKIADEKAREKFPQLPFTKLEEHTSEIRNELPGSGRLESSILEQVLFYIESHDGRVSVSECASQLSRPPGDVIKAILADALGMHLDQFQRISVDPCSLSVVRYTHLRPIVARMNDTGGPVDDLVPRPRRRRRSSGAVGGGMGGAE